MDFRKIFQMDLQPFWLGQKGSTGAAEEKAALRLAIFLVLIMAQFKKKKLYTSFLKSPHPCHIL